MGRVSRNTRLALPLKGWPHGLSWSWYANGVPSGVWACVGTLRIASNALAMH